MEEKWEYNEGGPEKTGFAEIKWDTSTGILC
jgi:hypothetical protein